MIRPLPTPLYLNLADGDWTLFSGDAVPLFDQQGLRLDDWLRAGRAAVVKKGPGRTIYRVRLAEGPELYIKHFRPHTWMNALHQLVRPDRARKECMMAQRLEQIGVATIRPIALGERRLFGCLCESTLITEAVPAAATLFDLMERNVQSGGRLIPPAQRLECARQLARLTAIIHEHGMEHRDLHERNLIVETRGQGRFRLHLLDLHELRLHDPLPWHLAVRELARMGRYFTLRTSAAERLRFFLEYADCRGIPRRWTRKLAREIEECTTQSRADFWRRRDRRSPRKSNRSVEYRCADMRAHASPDVPAEIVQALLRQPELPFQQAEVHWLKRGRGTRVAEIALPTLSPAAPLVYKQYFFKGWHESFFALIRKNQASRAWSAGASLLLRELPTAKPLVLLQQYRGGLPVTSYLLMERIPHAVPITSYLEQQLTTANPAAQSAIVAGVTLRAARLLRMLHDRRVSHRDLKASNILATATDHPAAPKLWLIDLDSVHTWLDVPLGHRLQNLARFAVSFHHSPWVRMTDRLRFLRAYLNRDFRDRQLWKRWWRAIQARVQSKIERNLRQGRSVV